MVEVAWNAAVALFICIVLHNVKLSTMSFAMEEENTCINSKVRFYVEDSRDYVSFFGAAFCHNLHKYMIKNGSILVDLR